MLIGQAPTLLCNGIMIAINFEKELWQQRQNASPRKRKPPGRDRHANGQKK
jgi:hypothetical protein